MTILERSIDRMRHLEEMLSGRVTLLMCSSLQIAASVEDADLVIGAVLIPGAVAPKLVTREMIATMKRGRGRRRRCDRPGRLLRDLTCDDACRAGVRRRRGHPLLRREHAGRRADHLDEGAHERDAALRRGDRRPRACARRSRPIRRSRRASTCSRARSPTRRSPRRTASTTRRSPTCCRSRAV